MQFYIGAVHIHVQFLAWIFQCLLRVRDVLQACYFIVCTRGIWKVLRMVFYLSNRFTNPIVFGIIVKSYLSSMLLHSFHEDIIMQTRKYYCEYMYCLFTGKRKISVENISFNLLKSVQNIKISS